MRTAIFDQSLKKEILEVFNKTVDDKGQVVEQSNPEQKVLSPDGEEVTLDNFAGVSKGSEIFIKSDLVSLIDFSKRGK